MKSFLLVSAQEDFSFPLAEAARKQIFLRAKTIKLSGDDPSILIVTPKTQEEFVQNDIPIRLTTRKGLYRKRWLLRESDQIEFWGTTGLIALKVGMFSRAGRKVFVATDGGVVSTGPKSRLRLMIAAQLATFYNELVVFTDYQRQILASAIGRRNAAKIISARPIVEPTPTLRTERAGRPTLLYMGHLSRYKGVDLLVRLFEDLLPEWPDLKLVICHNGLVYDEQCDQLVRDAARKFPDGIEIKGKVNPFEELARAHILVHPTQQHSGTFAFPLALWEAMATGTPFISTRLEGLAEFFDEQFLVPKDDYDSLLSMTRGMLLNPDAIAKKLADNRARLEERIQIFDDQGVKQPELSMSEAARDEKE